MAVEYNPVGWFEIPVVDMERAIAFYEFVLGVKLERHKMGDVDMAWFGMKDGEYGSAGALISGCSKTPSMDGISIYLSTVDIPTTLKRAAEKGGDVLLEKENIGEYGYIGFMADSEGNRIGLHSRD